MKKITQLVLRSVQIAQSRERGLKPKWVGLCHGVSHSLLLCSIKSKQKKKEKSGTRATHILCVQTRAHSTTMGMHVTHLSIAMLCGARLCPLPVLLWVSVLGC